MKRIYERRLNRRPKSIWHLDGRDDKFWQNLVNGISAESEWRTNFRLNRAEFMQFVE